MYDDYKLISLLHLIVLVFSQDQDVILSQAQILVIIQQCHLLTGVSHLVMIILLLLLEETYIIVLTL